MQFIKSLIPTSVKKMIPFRWVNINENHVLPKDKITYSNDLLYTYHNCDFINEKKFAEAYALVKKLGGSLLHNYDIQWRIHVLCWAGKLASKLEGDFVDCGVYTGFCPRAVIHYTQFETLGKKYFLFDTFSGMDARYASEYELQRNKELGYDSTKNLYEQVKETFKNFPVEIIKGPIPDTLQEAGKIEKIAYLSIDMNSVKPEVDALNYFWDKLVKGGIIVLDDYGYPGCEEQKKAHDDFARSKGVEVLSLPTCQGIIIK